MIKDSQWKNILFAYMYIVYLWLEIKSKKLYKIYKIIKKCDLRNYFRILYDSNKWFQTKHLEMKYYRNVK